MTRDGFSFLVMGFTGDGAAKQVAPRAAAGLSGFLTTEQTERAAR